MSQRRIYRVGMDFLYQVKAVIDVAQGEIRLENQRSNELS